MGRLFYIVESAFQLFGALEAIDYYKVSEYRLVIRLSNQENETQLIKMIDDLEVDKAKITFITGYKYGTLLKRILEFKFLMWLFFNKNKYTVFLLGDYHSGYLSLLRRVCLKDKKVIHLDDGSSTIRANNSFTEDKFFDWFTIYDLKKLSKQIIVQHDFPYLRSKIQNRVLNRNNTTIILGDKFYEAGLLTIDNSNKIMQQLMHKLTGEKVIYMAHRGESAEKLDYLRERYKISVIKNDFPIELYGFYTKELPKQVVSFFSTALFSLQKIYPEIEVTLYRIDTTMFTSHVEAYNDAYKAYEPHMKVIDLV